jgi:hypothetical protein
MASPPLSIQYHLYHTPFDAKAQEIICETKWTAASIRTGCIQPSIDFPTGKNCSPALIFNTSVRTGAALSSPEAYNKK